MNNSISQNELDLLEGYEAAEIDQTRPIVEQITGNQEAV